ncbi:RnfABCDGE type electron transport complex subunit D [Succinivibrio sp.]|uniref:RnfABCDGE type electron transport complex subunit D n=1 Tax=Succinivibrio sp. TaxID=2053619 RepID=UPI003869B6F3
MNISQSQGRVKQLLGLETAPHLKARMTTQWIMLIVLLSLIPAVGVEIYYFGFGIIFQFLNCTITAVVLEALVSLLRHQKISRNVGDLSAVVTSLILALTLPPMLPCYYSVVATVFAILIVKAIFGGLGQNIFNPAMAGFVFIMISCPGIVGSSYVSPAPQAYKAATLTESYSIIYRGASKELVQNQIDAMTISDDNQESNDALTMATKLLDKVDVMSGATYLDAIKSYRKQGELNRLDGHEFTSAKYQAYLALFIAYCIGGIVLMSFRIIIIRMVVAFFAAFILIQFVMHKLYPGYFMSVTDGLLIGGTMICAFYIMTDPVTNAGTSKGRIYFAVLLAFLIVFLRAFGSYNDTVAFAVMLSNACAPLIDVLTKRRAYGIKYRGKH